MSGLKGLTPPPGGPDRGHPKTTNSHKLGSGHGRRKKDVNFCVRSRNVYENKGNIDKMPGETTDIFGSLDSM